MILNFVEKKQPCDYITNFRCDIHTHNIRGNKERALEGIIRVITVIEMITANSFTFRSNVTVDEAAVATVLNT